MNERLKSPQRARCFKDDPQFSPSGLALLAVHSAISWNDAVLAKLDGKRHRAEDPMAAVRATKKRCDSLSLNREGVKQLEKLVKAKGRVSYGTERTTAEAAQVLSISAERFQAWANGLLKELR